MENQPTSAEEIRARAERYLAACSEYTDPGERERLIANWVRKGDVAPEVVGDFRRRAGEPRGKRLLEVGFGSGLFAVAFARAGAEVHGLEVNPVLLDIARENSKRDGAAVDLKVYDGRKFPYPDNFFDYAFSTSVLEHVSNPREVLAEIARVLKRGGKCYLSFPNRWAPLETHTHIWFLSFLPRTLAEFVMRRFYKRNAIEELNLHFLSYFKLRRLIRALPLAVCFEYEAKTTPRRIAKRVLGTFGIHHSAILRTVMVILEKEGIKEEF